MDAEQQLSRPYPFKFVKGCLPQILLGPFFEYFVPFSHIMTESDSVLIWENMGQ